MKFRTGHCDALAQRFEQFGQNLHPHGAGDNDGHHEGNTRVFSAELFDQTRPFARAALGRLGEDDGDPFGVEVLGVEELVELVERVWPRPDGV